MDIYLDICTAHLATAHQEGSDNLLVLLHSSRLVSL